MNSEKATNEHDIEIKLTQLQKLVIDLDLATLQFNISESRFQYLIGYLIDCVLKIANDRSSFEIKYKSIDLIVIWIDKFSQLISNRSARDSTCQVHPGWLMAAFLPGICQKVISITTSSTTLHRSVYQKSIECICKLLVQIFKAPDCLTDDQFPIESSVLVCPDKKWRLITMNRLSLVMPRLIQSLLHQSIPVQLSLLQHSRSMYDLFFELFEAEKQEENALSLARLISVLIHPFMVLRCSEFDFVRQEAESFLITFAHKMTLTKMDLFAENLNMFIALIQEKITQDQTGSLTQDLKVLSSFLWTLKSTSNRDLLDTTLYTSLFDILCCIARIPTDHCFQVVSEIDDPAPIDRSDSLKYWTEIKFDFIKTCVDLKRWIDCVHLVGSMAEIDVLIDFALNVLNNEQLTAEPSKLIALCEVFSVQKNQLNAAFELNQQVIFHLKSLLKSDSSIKINQNECNLSISLLFRLSSLLTPLIVTAQQTDALVHFVPLLLSHTNANHSIVARNAIDATCNLVTSLHYENMTEFLQDNIQPLTSYIFINVSDADESERIYSALTTMLSMADVALTNQVCRLNEQILYSLDRNYQRHRIDFTCKTLLQIVKYYVRFHGNQDQPQLKFRTQSDSESFLVSLSEFLRNRAVAKQYVEQSLLETHNDEDFESQPAEEQNLTTIDEDEDKKMTVPKHIESTKQVRTSLNYYLQNNPF